MSDLARDFEPVDPAEWLEAATRGKPIDVSTATDEGVDLSWLYTAADALAPDPGGMPAEAPFVRNGRRTRRWDMRQEHGHPQREKLSAAIVDDLEGGMTSTLLRLDLAARHGDTPGSEEFAEDRGRDGAAISTLDDLDAALAGVYVELAPVALDAGATTIAAAGLLAALLDRRGVEPAARVGSLRLDPIGTLARDGILLAAPEAAVTMAGELAAEVAAGPSPRLRALAVDTRAWVDAGATATQELGLALATAVEYLRACDRAGLAPAAAAEQIEFTLAVGPEQFMEIAKFRAVRRAWARILESCRVPAERRASPTYARTPIRMISAADPWVNLLRGTTAAFAAAVGGADGITVTPFDAAIGDPGGLGRRMARNTQMILMAESSLDRVADPAGGAWYVESLTDALAAVAWEEFQAIERAGGALAALSQGRIAEMLAHSGARRYEELAHRTRKLTGVNIFPLLGERTVEPEEIDLGALAALEAERFADSAIALPDAPPAADRRLRAATELAAAGARIDEILAALGAAPCTALPFGARRDSEAFETLRRRGEAGTPPARAFLACVGPLARHNTAATWAKGFFEVAGIETVPSGAVADPAEYGPGLRGSGAALAAVCAADDEEDTALAAAVMALREAGAVTVLLASAEADPARAAELGADGAVSEGIDMLAALESLLGTPASELDRHIWQKSSEAQEGTGA
ncbi:MAG TPA: methylmalonyl-CoA mutase family protein [Solirubrobacterales bacterium]|nr:methylmalonyl-CoA mutase family protein [Solirubrobacterales bacterium]